MTARGLGIGRGDDRAGWAGSRDGQALVEFALSSLLLMLLIFGMIDLGRATFTRIMVTNAVREAARQGSLAPSDTGTMVAAANARSAGLNLTSAMFTVSCADWQNNPRSCASGSTSPPSVQPLERLQVCLDYPFSLAAVRLIDRTSINFHECQRAVIQ